MYSSASPLIKAALNKHTCMSTQALLRYLRRGRRLRRPHSAAAAARPGGAAQPAGRLGQARQRGGQRLQRALPAAQLAQVQPQRLQRALRRMLLRARAVDVLPCRTHRARLHLRTPKPPCSAGTFVKENSDVSNPKHASRLPSANPCKTP